MLRIFGNILLLVGHTILLHFNVNIGIIIKLSGSIILIYCFYKIKYWDVIITMSSFSLLEIIKLFR